MPSNRFEIDAKFVMERFPSRKREAHKGMNGAVCVVGGSRTYHGAPFLCAMGAARTGVDLVYVAVPSTVAGPIRSLSPDLIVYPMPDNKLTRGNATRLAGWLPQVDAIAIGPGLGPQNPQELKNAIGALGAKCERLVVDADALRQPILEAPDSVRSKIIVTPHQGEFERLFSQKLPGSLEERTDVVTKAAKEHGLVIALKGPTDIVSDGESVGLNDTHSAAMTVGGTGDVLTGVAAGLAAKGMTRFDAACSAVYITGMAGEEAAKELGMHILASDVVGCLPRAMKRFDKLE